MSATHWMPFYPGDYLRDTMALSRADHGSYLLLIMAYWTSGGPLPNDPEYLAEIAKVPPGEWPSVSRRLERFFEVRDDAWHHSRIDKELATAKARHELRSMAGKRGAAAKRKQCSSNAQAGLNQPQPQPQPRKHERESEAERPSLDETKIYAQTIGLAEWKAVDWFDEMEGCGWLDFSHRPVSDWRAILRRVKTKWEADGRPTQPPTKTRVNLPASKPDHSQGF